MKTVPVWFYKLNGLFNRLLDPDLKKFRSAVILKVRQQHRLIDDGLVTPDWVAEDKNYNWFRQFIPGKVYHSPVNKRYAYTGMCRPNLHIKNESSYTASKIQWVLGKRLRR